MEKFPVFAARGPFAIVWSLLIVALSVASAALVPLALAFPRQTAALAGTFDAIACAFFLLDILVNANRAYMERQRPVEDRRAILGRYARTFLLVDLAAALPSALVAAGGPHAVALFRLLRLVKLAPATKRFRELGLGSRSPSLGRLMKMLFWLAVASHLIACGFLYIGGLPVDGDAGLAYLRALYWTVTTIATIGYGDITPDRNSALQLAYTIITELIGVGMYGFIIGNIATLIANLDQAKSQHRAKMDAVSGFLRERAVPKELRAKVNDYYTYLWETKQGRSDDSLMDELPASLRTEVSLHLNRDLIEKVPLFRGAGPELIEAIVLRLKPLVFLPGDRIIHKGDQGEDMFFISRGAVQVVSEDERTVFSTLEAGQFFGEMALLLATPRTATIRAVGYCDLYSLNKADFERVLADFPAFAASVRELAELRRKENEEAAKRG